MINSKILIFLISTMIYYTQITKVTCSDTGYLSWRIKIYKIDAVSFSKLMFGSLEIERAILKRLP